MLTNILLQVCFKRTSFSLAVLLFVLLSVPASAQNVYQTAQDGNWTASSTWVGNNKPGNVITNGETIIIDHLVNFDEVKINNGGNIIINAPVTGLVLDMNNGSRLTVNSTTSITNMEVNNGTVYLNAPLVSDNFSATGATIYTSDPQLLQVAPAVHAALVNNGDLRAPSTLPVTLISFTVRSVNGGNMLNWVTTQEYNSAYIALERSADGKNFQEINRQASTNNYHQQSRYQYHDERPIAGVNYYRLRQADTDGTISYSKIISSGASPFKIYNGEQLYFNAPVCGKATVISVAGTVVLQQELNQATEIILTNVPAGIYMLVLEQSNQVYKQKIVR